MALLRQPPPWTQTMPGLGTAPGSLGRKSWHSRGCPSGSANTMPSRSSTEGGRMKGGSRGRGGVGAGAAETTGSVTVDAGRGYRLMSISIPAVRRRGRGQGYGFAATLTIWKGRHDEVHGDALLRADRKS